MRQILVISFYVLTLAMLERGLASERHLDPNASMHIFTQSALTHTHPQNIKLSTQSLLIWGVSIEQNENLSYDVHALLPILVYGFYGNVRYAKKIQNKLYLAGKFNLGYTDFYVLDKFEADLQQELGEVSIDFDSVRQFLNLGFTPTVSYGNHETSISFSAPISSISNLNGDTAWLVSPTLATSVQIASWIKLNVEFLAATNHHSSFKFFALSYGARFFSKKNGLFMDFALFSPFGEYSAGFYEGRLLPLGASFVRLGRRF